MGLPLVTRAEYKSYAGISSTSMDTAIDLLIPKVSELVKSICRRTFIDYINDVKIEYSEGGTRSIELVETPVTQVVSVEFSGDYGRSYDTLAEYTDYAVSRASNSIRPIGSAFDLLSFSNSSINVGSTPPYGSKNTPMFKEAINGYRITYTGGYDAGIPEDLKVAVLDLLSYYLKNDSAVHTHKLAQPNTMQVEYITSTNLPAHIKRILDLYTVSYD